jgi:hypothetical protein
MRKKNDALNASQRLTSGTRKKNFKLTQEKAADAGLAHRHVSHYLNGKPLNTEPREKPICLGVKPSDSPDLAEMMNYVRKSGTGRLPHWRC